MDPNTIDYTPIGLNSSEIRVRSTSVADAALVPVSIDNLERLTVIVYGDRCPRPCARSRRRRHLGQRIATGYGVAPFTIGEP
jgi:hypothetical protein